MEATERVQDLLFITTELNNLLEKENAALRIKDMGVINELLDRKMALSKAYEIRYFGLQQSEEGFSGVDSALIEQLKEQSTRLDRLVEINAKTLHVGVSAGQHFMNILADSVQTATPNAGTYGANGQSGVRPGDVKKQCSSIAFDREL